jgi:hypothetical protein
MNSVDIKTEVFGCSLRICVRRVFLKKKFIEDYIFAW